MRLEFGDIVSYDGNQYKIVGENMEGEFRLAHIDNDITIEVEKHLVCFVCPNCEKIDAQV